MSLLTTTDTLTVASVPADHVYVRHVAAESPDGVVRLSDPQPDAAERSAEQSWWPPVILDPGWVHDHDFDVFHVHFGFDKLTPAELRGVVDAVHESGRPFVYTAHDLRNPHHASPERHDAQLDVLVQEADAVITLTPGAAGEIHRRWGRTAVVVPHPHVVDLDTMSRFARVPRQERSRPFRVGLHVKSVRASMDPMAVLPTLVRAVRGLPDAVLQVNGHRELLEPGGVPAEDELATYLRRAHARGDLELHVHDFMSDDELWDYLASLDASVLAYRFGTHSGWLEACRDLGTAVVAPTCGFYADQGPVHAFHLDEHGFDPESLVHAVTEAHRQGAPDPVPVAERRRQRRSVADAHRELYRRLA
jgi:glycosyltransferase involved in cell wall biosynthesis